MKHHFPYRKTYLKNLLASLLVTVILCLLVILSVYQGKHAIIKKQELACREWRSACSLLVKKPGLLEESGIIPDADAVPLPEPFRNGLPDTRTAEIFQRRLDSVAKTPENEQEGNPSRACTELEDSISLRIQNYNRLVRESNHFMKEFPNNFYSAVFRIPSLPEYDSGSILTGR